MYQSGALWSSLTLAENIALPLEENSDLGPKAIRDLVSYKLSLVGLKQEENSLENVFQLLTNQTSANH